MSRTKAFSNSNVSLTPQIFYILMALAEKERHGYEVMKQVEYDSNKQIKLGPGTLYGAIKRMLEEKLIFEIVTTNTRRKYYKLTEKGRKIFLKELQRYSEAVTIAKKRSLFAAPSITKLTFVYE